MKRMLVKASIGLFAGAFAVLASAHPMHGGSPLSILTTIKDQLNLNTAQQQQWDNVMALSASARNTMRANFKQAQAALQAELAKAEPDFASLAASADSARAQAATLHKQVRDAWLALYATFTPEQKGITRDAITAKMEKMQARRAAHQQRAPDTSN